MQQREQDVDLVADLHSRIQRLEHENRRRALRLQRVRRVAKWLLGGSVLVLPAVATAVDVPHVFQAGDPVRASDMNENFTAIGQAIDDGNAELEALRDRVIVSGRSSGGVVLPAGQQTVLAFQPVIDTHGLVQPDGSGTRIVVPEPGIYEIEANVWMNVAVLASGARWHLNLGVYCGTEFVPFETPLAWGNDVAPSTGQGESTSVDVQVVAELDPATCPYVRFAAEGLHDSYTYNTPGWANYSMVKLK